MRDPEDLEGKRSRTDAAARADRRSHAHRGSGELRDAFPALVGEWQAYWQEQPWHGTWTGSAPDSVLEVLRAILDAAMEERDARPVYERLLRAAVAHGEQRCEQGVSDQILLGEYHALRKALWRHLLHAMPIAEGMTTIMRIDVLITASSGLALRGFMRDQLDANFPWERELARTLTEVSEGLARALR